MKITQIGRVRPVLGVSSLGAGGGGIEGPGVGALGFPTSGTIPTSTGSNTWAWGSNVAIITSNGSNTLVGPFISLLSGTGIAFAAASNSLTISSTVVGGGGGGGAAATDPTIPTGGTLYDGSTTSGWTSFGASLTFDANSTVANHFYLAKTTMGSGEIVGAYRSISSLPRTITAKFSGWFDFASFDGIDVIIGEASPGKFLALGSVRDGSTIYNQRSLWTNATTVGSQANLPSNLDWHLISPLWYRLVVTSSTSIDGYVSRNGYIYYPLFTAFNPSFTVGTFGFSMHTFGAHEMKAAIDWIHET
jgi:hypothetical protein